jgi:hypothetical protein
MQSRQVEANALRDVRLDDNVDGPGMTMSRRVRWRDVIDGDHGGCEVFRLLVKVVERVPRPGAKSASLIDSSDIDVTLTIPSVPAAPVQRIPPSQDGRR